MPSADEAGFDPWERCRLPDNLSFEDWVNYVFDHPVLDPQWWWQNAESGYRQEWDDTADPARTLSYLTQLFNQPRRLIGRFSRAQIDQGLNFIVSETFSHMYVLRDIKLPWPDRRACLDAMIPLYAELMAPVYGNDLGHLRRETCETRDPIFACYMWWDIIPIYATMDHIDRDRINDAVLNVFEQVLTLKAESCLESVIHGLGHWYYGVAERTKPIVRKFLTRTDISHELRQYAEYAAVGAVQ